MRDDKLMIQSPDRWPHSVCLPVKRSNPAAPGLPYDFGLIMLGNPFAVALANLYDSAEQKAAAPRLNYPTIEALLADGWHVD